MCKHLLWLFIIPTIILLSASAYFRFIVQQDYLVLYDVECDPITNSCYIYCEDDDCEYPYYYSLIERYAYEIYESCGDDLSQCESATQCSDDVYCEQFFCDTLTDECST